MTELNRRKSRKTTLGIAIGFVVFVLVVVWALFSDTTPAQQQMGYNAEPVVVDGISYELTGSDTSGTKHTFYLTLKNTGDNPKDTSTTFNIVNGDKRFSPDDRKYSASKLNPGIDGTVAITFTMPTEDLSKGTPKLEIKRGIFVTEKKEIALVK